MGTLGGKGLRYIEDQNTPPVLKHLNKSQEGNDSKLLQNVSRQNMLCRTSGTAAKLPKLSYVWQHKEGAANLSECAGYSPNMTSTSVCCNTLLSNPNKLFQMD